MNRTAQRCTADRHCDRELQEFPVLDLERGSARLVSRCLKPDSIFPDHPLYTGGDHRNSPAQSPLGHAQGGPPHTAAVRSVCADTYWPWRRRPAPRSACSPTCPHSSLRKRRHPGARWYQARASICGMHYPRSPSSRSHQVGGAAPGCVSVRLTSGPRALMPTPSGSAAGATRTTCSPQRHRRTGHSSSSSTMSCTQLMIRSGPHYSTERPAPHTLR